MSIFIKDAWDCRLHIRQKIEAIRLQTSQQLSSTKRSKTEVITEKERDKTIVLFLKINARKIHYDFHTEFLSVYARESVSRNWHE